MEKLRQQQEMAERQRQELLEQKRREEEEERCVVWGTVKWCAGRRRKRSLSGLRMRWKGQQLTRLCCVACYAAQEKGGGQADCRDAAQHQLGIPGQDGRPGLGFSPTSRCGMHAFVLHLRPRAVVILVCCDNMPCKSSERREARGLTIAINSQSWMVTVEIFR
jgi:hypothetical protein